MPMRSMLWDVRTVSFEAAKAPLLGILLDAPLIATSARWPRELHAVDIPELLDRYAKGLTVTAACGATGLRVVGQDGYAVLWPPRVKGLASKVRCGDCWERTGRKRPRATFRGEADDA